MPAPLEKTALTVALIGNPNTGKSTLFSALVGIHQHVGNYPGVTVENKTGRMEHEGRAYEVVDLPGLYSLAARSRDEMVAVNVLLGRQQNSPPVDAVVAVLDAGNLERNLYLLSQVLELGLPTVVALNMVDVAAGRGIGLDAARLERRLGLPVIAMQANRGIGMTELKAALATTISGNAHQPISPFPEVFEREVIRLDEVLGGSCQLSVGSCQSPIPNPQSPIPSSCPLNPALLRRLLLDASGWLQTALLPDDDGTFARELDAARARLNQAGCPIPGIETAARYGWARSIMRGAVREPKQYRLTTTDRIDRVLTHRFWGTLVFALVMVLMFQSVFVWARPVMTWIEAADDMIGARIEGAMAEGPLRSLLVEGVLGGVGSVLMFLPQILVLFFFIAVLEDCGYMARAAYLMDRVMVRVGLSGRSFIPMLASFGCAVPAIMAARVIENERDRLTTILVAPLLTCSARLPVYALLIAAFIPANAYLGGLLGLQGLVLTALYALGIVAAIAAALVLKRTLLRGRTPPFLLELPSYKWPSPRTVLLRVADRGLVFLRTAGTLILAVSIVVWAALHYPTEPHQSCLERLGRAIEPAVKPLGWDWRIGCSVLASLPAREIVVATLGVMYGADNRSADVPSAEKNAGVPPAEITAGETPALQLPAGQLQAKLRAAVGEDGRPAFTIPVALSIMVFFALCAQCAATLAVIRRETNSWRWPAFTFTYMTTLAYLGALVTYQVGTWLGG